MDVTILNAEPRVARGTRQVARLRAEGKVPAVVYGLAGDNELVAIDGVTFERELRKHHRLFQLEYSGKRQAVFLQDIQFDVLDDRPVHVDLKRVDLDAEIEVEVELDFLGHPAGASQGGVLVKDRVSITIRVLPRDIPDGIPVSVKDLGLGDEIRIADLTLPASAKCDESPDTVVCHIGIPTSAQPEPVAEEAPAEGDAESGAGEAGEGEAEKGQSDKGQSDKGRADKGKAD